MTSFQAAFVFLGIAIILRLSQSPISTYNTEEITKDVTFLKHSLLSITHRQLRYASRPGKFTGLYIGMLLLALPNDTQTNPGPIKFPCGTCNKPVASNQKATSCDSCNTWFHTKCTKISNKIYSCMNKTNMENVSWYCPGCGLPNLSSIFFDPPYLTDCDSNRFSPSDNDSNSLRFSSVSSYGSPIAHSSPCTTQPEPPLRDKIKVRNKNNNLRAIIINFQSLKNKKPDLQLTIDNTNPDIIFGCETWLNKNIETHEIIPDNYIVYRKDRSSKGGGVLIAIKKTINSSIQNDLDTDGELIWAKIKSKNNPDLYICSFYRPPTDETRLTHLRHSISRISQNCKHNIWIAGDFNCPKINWTSLTCPENDQTSTNLLDLTKDFHLHQAVREPTRGKNILELFLTTNPSLIESTHSIPGISDHDSIPLLNINVNLPRNIPPPYKIFKYHKADWEHIDQELQDLGNKIQNQAPLTDSPEPRWDLFKHSIQEIINQFIPFKYSSKRYPLPWINKDIQK